MMDETIIFNDTIVLSDKEIILPNNIIFIDHMRNTINGKRYIDSTEKGNVTQYEIIPFTKDFSAESDVDFLAGENNPSNMNLMTAGLDEILLNMY